MRLNRLELAAPAGKASASSVTLAGKPVPHRMEMRENRLALVFPESVILELGKTLEVVV
jgi:hypothetical protein